MSRAAGAAVLVAIVAVAGLFAHVSSARITLSAATATCDQKATVIGVRGSGDPQSGDAKTDRYGDSVDGMGQPGAAFAVDLANRLPQGVVTFLPIIYPAVGLLGDRRKVGTWGKYINALGAGFHVGFLGAYTGSVNDGKRMLRKTISDEERLCSSIKLVLVGYSQGAQVVGDVYERDLTSRQRSRIAGVVLFGDPYFDPNDSSSDVGSFDPTRHGVLGTRGDYPANTNGRVFSVCHVHDPICQGPGRINFAQHANYQSDSWVKTAAAKIAAGLSTSSQLPGLYDGTSKFSVKPPVVVVDCADEGEYRLHWTSWTATQAVGEGKIAPCRGPVKSVSVTASHVVEHEFTQLNVNVTGDNPRVMILAGYHGTPPLSWALASWVQDPNSGLQAWPFH